MKKNKRVKVTLCVAETGVGKGKASSVKLQYKTGESRVRRASMSYMLMLVREFERISGEGGKDVWERMTAEEKPQDR